MMANDLAINAQQHGRLCSPVALPPACLSVVQCAQTCFDAAARLIRPGAGKAVMRQRWRRTASAGAAAQSSLL